MTRLPRRRLGTIWVCVLSAALTLTACASEPPAAAPSRGETPSPTPTPTPLTPVEALLATTADPAACAVSFAGDGIADAPVLETGGTLYAALPIPQREGAVFAGWYATPDDAAALAIPGRVNGSELVTCTGRERTLHAGWVTPERNAAEGARIPILMYHQFTAKPEGESGWLRGNYAYVGDWDAHLGYIAAQGFYLPTWLELDAFIDGRLFLPDHSVIVTDDDGDPTWLELAVPLVAKHAVMTTSFVITDGGPGPDLTPYVLKRSHTGHLHTAGANGKGQMINLSPAEIAADLEASAATLGGVKEVVAYPFGHYDERTKQGTAQAGFSLGRTIEQGYVAIGQDKLALPSVRVNYGMDVDDLRKLIG
ncbi:polysaccharide deacetylase family protein [Microbacterium sp. W1N]|uniref:polysaccharide deacetylase family protein n=1 Tax=Microbacterium festucae TaxID=2977531 RepID=UPI0021BFC7C1|nr:polysaccharide deacetylase family protein [Microbacterium festucae]MCT9819235.1 polysaccharide deacetylase family protein [Microbacterium festucae]